MLISLGGFGGKTNRARQGSGSGDTNKARQRVSGTNKRGLMSDGGVGSERNKLRQGGSETSFFYRLSKIETNIIVIFTLYNIIIIVDSSLRRRLRDE